MLDTIRKYVEAGMGAVSNTRAEQIAKGFAKQGTAGKDQVTKVAREIVDWSKKNGERLVTIVRREVKKQILAMGVASKADIDALKKRVTALEGRGSSTPKSTTRSSKTTTRKSGGSRPAASGRTTGVKTTGAATGGAPAAATRKSTTTKGPSTSGS